MTKIQHINIDLVKTNTGQIPGVPANPRIYSEAEIKELARSIQETPELLEMRPVLVYPLSKVEFVAIGGNMRLEACKLLKMAQVPCFVLSKKTSKEKLLRLIILDNAQYGEWVRAEVQKWDIANQWKTHIVMTGKIKDFSEGVEINIGEFDETMMLCMNFTEDEFNFVKSRLAEIDKDERTAILKLLNYGMENDKA